MKNNRRLNILAIFTVLFVGILYFQPIWKNHLVPFPGHLLVSFFSPWKEISWDNYPTGVPRKDLLGFDTVRMMGPWRHFVTKELKIGRLPSWNPHQFGGAPLLANSQSAVFFPLNWLYLLVPFETAWTLLIIIQPLLAAIGMYWLLKSFKHSQLSALFVALAYGFSGWMSVWVEWNIHGFVYALLPWTLLLINKKRTLLTILALTGIILAGHPQVSLIGFFAISSYSIIKKRFRWFIKPLIIVITITAIQWVPTLTYFKQASREQPSSEFVYEKTLLPWQQLPQLLAPNILGNPATGNFSGPVNFVETTAYSGIALIAFALLGLASINKFPIWLIGTSLLFSLPNPFSQTIGKLGIPLLSSSVASRWLVLLPLGIALLAAPGIDNFLALKKKISFRSLMVLLISIIMLWAWAFVSQSPTHLIARRHLIIPTGIILLILITALLKNKFLPKNFKIPIINYGYLSIVTITIFELIRFGQKTMTYTEKAFVYPSTPVIEKLKDLSRDGSRFASSPGSVIESNFATRYGLYDLSGYDALYPRRIGELVWAAHHQGQPQTDFSRSTVVVPTDNNPIKNNLWNLAGIRWVIHSDDLLSQHPGHNSSLFPTNQYQLVWEDQNWQIYENLQVFPRAFFIKDASWIGASNDIIEKTLISPPSKVNLTPADIITYLPNQIEISLIAPSDGYLVLTDTYYPGWKATLDQQPVNIIPAFHAFRAIPVTTGNHTVQFKYISL